MVHRGFQAHRASRRAGKVRETRLSDDGWMSVWVGLIILAMTFACASPPPPSEELNERIEKAERGLEDDPRLRARRAAIEAARARERDRQVVEEVELRVGDNYVNEHHIRVMARVPLKRPAELAAQKRVYRAETEMAVARLEETSLERRAELCFPSVEALAHEQRLMIYSDYAKRQQELIEWNSDRQRSGLVSEIEGTRFDLESRIKLTTQEPLALAFPPLIVSALPEVDTSTVPLDMDRALLREILSSHSPSVSLRRANAERYRALMERARIRTQPWIKFVDITYDHDTTTPARNGGGGKVAFQIPLGGKSYADVGRYAALAREQKDEAEGQIEERLEESLRALNEINNFELRSERWRELSALAVRAEEVADRWWRQRLASPEDVANLFDEAFAARAAVVDMRERAGLAGCTVLVVTGIPVEDWPRGTGLSASQGADLSTPALSPALDRSRQSLSE